jgi:beta-galactosidase
MQQLPLRVRLGEAARFDGFIAGANAEVLDLLIPHLNAGKPAITLNEYGRGKVVYVGTLGPAGLFDALAEWFLDLARLAPILAVPEGVEVAERWRGDRRLLFLLNHTGKEQQVALDREYAARLGGPDAPDLSGLVTLPPQEVLVLEPTPKT